MKYMVLVLLVYEHLCTALWEDVASPNVWPTKAIPYRIHPRVMNASLVREAIDYFNSLSCVQWKPHENEAHYIMFKRGTTCNSEVGLVFTSSPQTITLAPHCNSLAFVWHEMLHAVGMRHEMRRTDRDKHIEVFYEYIQTGYERYFDKLRYEELYFPHSEYDIKSILHYASFDYSVSPKIPAILLRNNDVILRNSVPSKGDIEKLKSLYDCRENATKGWSSWSVPSHCNDDCTKRQTRFCFTTTGDLACKGPNIRVEKCSAEECKRDGSWSRWSSWGGCNIYCGTSTEIRARRCVGQRLDGKSCEHSEAKQTRLCKRGQCIKGRYDCEFDNDGFALWDVVTWKRQRASLVNDGPITDVSFRTGYYAILRENETGHAIVEINSYEVTYRCFLFYYMNVGDNSAGLNVLVNYGDNNIAKITGTEISTNNSDWITATIALQRTPNQVVISGIAPMKGFLAIDDLFFKRDHCADKNVRRLPNVTPTTINRTSPPTSSSRASTITTRTEESSLTTKTSTHEIEKFSTLSTLTPLDKAEQSVRTHIPTKSQYYSKYENGLLNNETILCPAKLYILVVILINITPIL